MGECAILAAIGEYGDFVQLCVDLSAVPGLGKSWDLFIFNTPHGTKNAYFLHLYNILYNVFIFIYIMIDFLLFCAIYTNCAQFLPLKFYTKIINKK